VYTQDQDRLVYFLSISISFDFPCVYTAAAAAAAEEARFLVLDL